jgi:bifunctional DNA-binding transcriptional regulator/antitoxin component of YhaV-PrlF toxin-antitoxin module
MAKTGQGIFSITRLGANGRLTIPKEYRHVLSVSPDTAVVLVQVGDALVIAPCDEALAAVSQRLEAQMQKAGSDVEDLIDAAAEARADIVREEFGEAAKG